MDTPVQPRPLTFSKRLRLLVKWLMYPGSNWASRDRRTLTRTFLAGADRSLRTLDCGCGNAYFTYEAYVRGSTCVGITLHEWERANCVEMRDYLGIPAEHMEFRRARLEHFVADTPDQGRFDQVLMLEVLEHIRDHGAALRQAHSLLSEDGFLFLSVPNRDWQPAVLGPRVSRTEDGWHVRNGYTFEQLEALLSENGFEPIDRLRFGSRGTTAIIAIQRLFGRHLDALTVACFPILWVISMLLSPWRHTHSIFVLARKRSEPSP